MSMPPGPSALPRGCCPCPFAPQIDSQGKVGRAGLRSCINTTLFCGDYHKLVPFSLSSRGQQQQLCFWFQTTVGPSMLVYQILDAFLNGEAKMCVLFSNFFLLHVVKVSSISWNFCFGYVCVCVYTYVYTHMCIHICAYMVTGLLDGNGNVFHYSGCA